MLFRSVCYMTLSELAQQHPECFDLAQVVFAEQLYLAEEWKETLIKYGMDENIAYGDVESALTCTLERNPGNHMFLTNYYRVLQKRMSLLAEVASSVGI